MGEGFEFEIVIDREDESVPDDDDSRWGEVTLHVRAECTAPGCAGYFDHVTGAAEPPSGPEFDYTMLSEGGGDLTGRLTEREDQIIYEACCREWGEIEDAGGAGAPDRLRED